MGRNDKPEVVDADEEIANLFEDLGRYDKKIHNLKGELEKADEFIESVAGSDADRAGLEQSMGIDVARTELLKHEVERDRIAKDIEKLQKATLGEEIPRNKDGQYRVPWDELRLAEAQAQVNAVFRGIK